MIAARAALAWRILRGEGPPAVLDRALERLFEARRRRSYPLRRRHAAGGGGAAVEAAPASARDAPVLNYLATPPDPWLGGLQVQLMARLQAESSHRPVALLYADRSPSAYRLEIRRQGRRWREEWSATRRPPAAALVDEGLARVVSGALSVTGARVLHVEGLAGVPLATLLALAESGLPIILSLHDFAAFCPRPNLLEAPHDVFCGYSRERGRCARCLAVTWPVGEGFQEERRAVAARLLRAARALVFPSGFLRRTYNRLFPGLDPARQTVIPPGYPEIPRPRRSARDDGELHVGFVGGARTVKGLAVLRQVIASTADRPFRWTVFGGGDPAAGAELRRLPRVEVRGYYRRGRLPRLLERREVDIGLLLSAVPETYSLALDELAAAGIPTIAFERGALGERSRELRAGLLVDPSEGAAGVVRKLEEVSRSSPPPPLPPPCTSDAARAVLSLYAETTPPTAQRT